MLRPGNGTGTDTSREATVSRTSRAHWHSTKSSQKVEQLGRTRYTVTMRLSHLRVRSLAAMGMVVIAGCTPPWSAFEAEDPVAIRTTSSGEVEVLLVPCSPAGITSIEVTEVHKYDPSQEDPRIWQVDFSPPVTNLHSFVLGQAPPQGAQQVPWPSAGLGEEYGYIVEVQLDGRDYWVQGFHRQDLPDDQILFHNELLSRETFAERSRCPDPNAPPTPGRQS